MSEVLRRSGEWVLLTGVQIADPDGWDRTDFQRSWNEPISRAEFARRVRRSTVYMDEAFEALEKEVQS
jgi:hypothetical protein